MSNLKTVTAVVKHLLQEDAQCRNSDNVLYLKVLEIYGRRKGLDINKMSIPYFLLNMAGTAFPPFESVRRARQKIQEHHPDLAACEAVKDFRTMNEDGFREYARGTV